MRSLVLVAVLMAAPAFGGSFETRLSPSPLTDGTRVNITGEGPVGKPTTLLPDIHHPNNGNGIFVFALPDN